MGGPPIPSRSHEGLRTAVRSGRPRTGSGTSRTPQQRTTADRALRLDTRGTTTHCLARRGSCPDRIHHDNVQHALCNLTGEGLTPLIFAARDTCKERLRPTFGISVITDVLRTRDDALQLVGISPPLRTRRGHAEPPSIAGRTTPTPAQNHRTPTPTQQTHRSTRPRESGHAGSTT